MIMLDGKKVPEYTAEKFTARNRHYDQFMRENPDADPNAIGIPETRPAYRVVESRTGRVVDDNDGYGYDRKAGAAVRVGRRLKKNAINT